jgi:hypothetical protein
LPLLAIHFGKPEVGPVSGAHRIVRFPLVARVVQSQNTTTRTEHESHGAIKVIASTSLTDSWQLSDESLGRALFRFARDHAETLARHQGRHMGGDHEYVVSPHEYSGPPPTTEQSPESTVVHIELDNPLRHLAP